MKSTGHLYPRFGKRLFDIFLSVLLLVGLAPVLLIVALFVHTRLGSPILFKQERPGRNSRLFRILKFRTMTDARDENGALLPDSVRLTKLGRLLRSTSLDELPELFNVLRGEMSLVGPRPLRTHYLKLYSPQQARRHEIRPGITGWAQVNGRNALSWEERFRYDVWYVDHVTFMLDLKILFLTAWKVVRRDGINAEGEVTMNEFKGNEGKSKDPDSDPSDPLSRR